MKNDLDAAVLAELAENGGAILGWQVANPAAYADAFAAGAICFDADSDCYVHPAAIANGDGSYSMPAD